MASIGIVGAGSIGLLFAAKLANAGMDVHLFARNHEQLADLMRNGVLLDGQAVSGITFHSSMNRSGEEAKVSLQLVILTMKNHQVTDLLMDWLERRFEQQTCFVLMQNGIGHVERMLARFRSERLFVAVTTEGALKTGHSEVIHTGSGTTYLGAEEHCVEIPVALNERLDAFQKAGFHFEWVHEIMPYLWKKWIMNCVINPITAIQRVRNGAIVTEAVLTEWARKLFVEAYAVAVAERQLLPQDEAGLWHQLLRVCEQTRMNRSSMLQDVEADRETEWDALNGELLRRAVRFGIEVPDHDALAEKFTWKGRFE